MLRVMIFNAVGEFNLAFGKLEFVEGLFGGWGGDGDNNDGGCRN